MKRRMILFPISVDDSFNIDASYF